MISLKSSSKPLTELELEVIADLLEYLKLKRQFDIDLDALSDDFDRLNSGPLGYRPMLMILVAYLKQENPGVFERVLNKEITHSELNAYLGTASVGREHWFGSRSKQNIQNDLATSIVCFLSTTDEIEQAGPWITRHCPQISTERKFCQPFLDDELVLNELLSNYAKSISSKL